MGDSNREFGQRILVDVLCVVVLFALRWAIRTENSGGCALCGRPFQTSTDNSDREFWRLCSVWSSLSDSDRQFEQRILVDVLYVVVPFALRRSIRTENSGGYALCGRSFRAPAINSNREFWRMCSLWSSFLRSGDQFEQRILVDVLHVVVPYKYEEQKKGLRQA